jgi:tetratricopeptide (TPR) repeat protein
LEESESVKRKEWEEKMREKIILNADNRRFHADSRRYLRKFALDLRPSALRILLVLFFCVTASVCLASEPKMSAAGYYERAYGHYQEIQIWKKEKNWANVYDKGPALKKGIAEDLIKAELISKNNAPLFFDIKFLRWLSLFDDDPETAFGLYDKVVAAAKEAAATRPGLEAVKKAADGIKDLEDKNYARRLYEVYAGAVAASGLTPEELLTEADSFLSAGNIYLAKTLYEAMLSSSWNDKTSQAKRIIAVADKFAHPGDKEALDPVYAEGLYQKAQDLAGDVAFDAEAQYRRAFNLERIKDYDAAKAQYMKLLSLFPDAVMRPEVIFRLGVFEAYVYKNIPGADEYFKKITTGFPKDALVLSALYQEGLLAQANKDAESAAVFYNALLSEAQARGLEASKTELVALAQERLKEVTDKTEMKYGLRLFMEGILAGASPEMAASPIHVDVAVQPARTTLGAPVKWTVTTSHPETGCMTPTYAYEWSGELGGTSNISNTPEITTTYTEAGLHVVGAAVVGPNGPEGAGFDIVQIK